VKTLQVTVNNTTSDGTERTVFFRVWALPDQYIEPIDERQLMTRLQTQVNSFVKGEEDV
jgi:hypothetical protein